MLILTKKRFPRPGRKTQRMKHLIFLIILSSVMAACTPNQRIVESGQTPPRPATDPTKPASSFEGDLQAMRNADFKFILVFRRKDGAVMDAEDKTFVNAFTPPDANRRKLSDEGKAIVIGSNFPFFPGTIVALTDRFIMEDHSKPDSGPIEVDRLGNSKTSNSSNENRGIVDTETEAKEAEKNEPERRHPQNKR